jgi:hypothetical protein
MSDQWTIHGREYGNCNCDWGCPCQFNAPSTHGRCEAVVGGTIETGHFNETQLDGLNWAMVLQWPGEIAEGNGRQQVIIDERADPEQRIALGKILLGESTAPGATHFFVYNSTMSAVLETLFAPVHILIDIDGRSAEINVPGLIESKGSPIVNPNDGEPYRARIDLPNGFEYSIAEIGTGTSTTRTEISLDLSNSYGQFNELHMNQDGLIR